MSQPEDIRTGVIWLIAAALAVVTAICFVIAWHLIEPPPPYAKLPSTTLEHGLIDQAYWVDPGTREIERTEWVDRARRTVRIPIEAAIEAVVVDPGLITTHRAAEASR
jgi:hypothetical protein